jgi:cell fate (sporulation/competence/biofilm development) regulator YlbF (YheA/YmcA/DUF963 family)
MTQPEGSIRPPEKLKRRRLNADEKGASKSVSFAEFAKRYERKRQKGVEPNERRYDRGVEEMMKHAPPIELDQLLRDDEDWSHQRAPVNCARG